MRRRNDIYTTLGGIKNKASGPPYTGKIKRLGTSKLRFEAARKGKPESIEIFEVNDELEPTIWEDNKIKPEVREALLKIVKDFLIDLPFDLDVEDIT